MKSLKRKVNVDVKIDREEDSVGQSVSEQKTENTYVPRRHNDLFLVAILVFAVALIAEMLFFVHNQAGKLAAQMSEDCVILLVADSKVTTDQFENVTDLIKETAGVKQVRFLSKEMLLDQIKEDDKELVDSVMKTGRNANPLPDVWEVMVEEDGLVFFSEIVQKLLMIEQISDAQYKEKEAEAIRHFIFYKRFTGVALSFSSMLIILFVLLAIACRKSASQAFANIMGEDFPYILTGLFAGIAAFATTYMFLLPVRGVDMFWSWTVPSAQVLLVLCCALFGWGIRVWKK